MSKKNSEKHHEMMMKITIFLQKQKSFSHLLDVYEKNDNGCQV